MAPDLVRHPHPAVGHRQAGPLPLQKGPDLDPPSRGKRIHGIEDEVHDHLPQRRWVAGNRRDSTRPEGHLDGDPPGLGLVLPARLRHLEDFAGQRVEVQLLAFLGRAHSRKSLDPPHHLRRVACRPLNRLKRLPTRPHVCPLQEQLGPPEDHGQEVV